MGKSFDVIVIGAGPGGYIAAIRAAQLGMNVACIDEWKNASGGPAPGGTCTNVGCIPSKALLQSSEHFEQANHHFAEHGITATGVKMDVAKMLARKDTVVKQNNDGILYLFKKNKVTFFHGRGSFASKSEAGYEIKVSGKTEESLTAKQIIVATGSSARALPGVPLSSRTTTVPKATLPVLVTTNVNVAVDPTARMGPVAVFASCPLVDLTTFTPA
jgi:dihydrolipoamide dehydrogenase